MRGTCTFSLKAKHAADAGAEAMILVNAKGRRTLAYMSGTSSTPLPETYRYYAIGSATLGAAFVRSLKYAKAQNKNDFQIELFCGRTRDYNARQIAVRPADPYTGKMLNPLFITQVGYPGRIHNVKKGEYERQIEADPVSKGFASTAFHILPYTDAESIRPTNGKKVYKYGQFAVVYGFQRDLVDEGEEIRIQVYTQQKEDGGYAVHSYSTIDRVSFVDGQLGLRGLTAQEVYGGFMVIWVHKFAAIEQDVLMLQTFDYEATATGIPRVLTPFDRAGRNAGPMRFPRAAPTPASGRIRVIWSQAAGVGRNKAPLDVKVQPTDMIVGLSITSAEFAGAIPRLVSDKLGGAEDTKLEISLADFLDNDIAATRCIENPKETCTNYAACGCDAGQVKVTSGFRANADAPLEWCYGCYGKDTAQHAAFSNSGGTFPSGPLLTLLDVEITGGKLVQTPGGEPLAEFGTVEKSGVVTTKAGLVGDYFPADKYLDTDLPAGEGFFPPSIAGMFKKAITNTLKFPPDFSQVESTLAQANTPDSAWPGLPSFMTTNYFARLTGKLEIAAGDTYQFMVDASTAAELLIDGEPVMATKAFEPPSCKCNGDTSKNYFGGGSHCTTVFNEKQYCCTYHRLR